MPSDATVVQFLPRKDLEPLRDKDLAGYSPTRHLAALATGDWRDAGKERELETHLRGQMRSAGGEPPPDRAILVPTQVFFAPPAMRAALDATTSGKGPEMIFTRPGIYGEALTATPQVLQLGASTILDPAPHRLVQETAFASVESQEEGGTTVSESLITTRAESATPPRQIAFLRTSNQLLQQSDFRARALRRLSIDLAVRADWLALRGSGEDAQPAGLFTRADIAAVALGDNGAAITPAKLLQAQREVAESGAEMDGARLGTLTTPKVREVLQQTSATTGGGPFWRDGLVVDHPGRVSINVPSTLTKGTGTGLHGAVYGAWENLVLVMAPAVEIVVDPYTLAGRGETRLIARLYIHAGVVHPEAFRRFVDIDVS